VEPTSALIEVVLGGRTIASTRAAYRVLETSHPPTFYLPVDAFVPGTLRPTGGSSFCEWKGRASYFDVLGGTVVADRAAWTYPEPAAPFQVLVGHVALYPAAMDRCSVDGETVVPQPGGFYGGWVTSRVVGPFKGGPGTHGW
jgi:uncharacterized protein (DUF427 family)